MIKLNYKNWDNCYKLSNGIIELILTTDVGPRIINFKISNQKNVFKEYPDMLGKTGGDDWRIYGGHRFWHAPEKKPRTYYPDNEKVQIKKLEDNAVRLVQKTENTTLLQKEIDIKVNEKKPSVTIIHRLRNKGYWTIDIACWGLSVMKEGGVAILPLPPKGTHPEDLLPNTSVILWPYTDISDKRWVFGNKYILLKQDKHSKNPQKIGLNVNKGWAAYHIDNTLFVKTFDYFKDKIYPDLGSTVEVFTNSQMLELETLSPLQKLQPGKYIEHKENWFLFTDIEKPNKDSDVDENILPKIAEQLNK